MIRITYIEDGDHEKLVHLTLPTYFCDALSALIINYDSSHPFTPFALYPSWVSRGLMHNHIHHAGLPSGEPFFILL
jgi:hypothetical protein